MRESLRRRFRKKGKEQSGLTLVEMLCASAILILLGLMVNTGIQMAVTGYREMVAHAELQLLLSTLADAVTDDLRFAQEVQTDGSGKLASFLDASGAAGTLNIGGDGQVYAAGKRVLPPGAYGKGAYRAEKLDVSFSEDDGLFTVRLAVGEAEGEQRAEVLLTVRCLNPPYNPPD